MSRYAPLITAFATNAFLIALGVQVVKAQPAPTPALAPPTLEELFINMPSVGIKICAPASAQQWRDMIQVPKFWQKADCDRYVGALFGIGSGWQGCMFVGEETETGGKAKFAMGDTAGTPPGDNCGW